MGVRTPSQMKAVSTNLVSLITTCESDWRRPSLETEHTFRIAVEHSLHDVGRITEFVPFAQQAGMGDAGIIAAEDNLIRQAPANINFQLSGEIFRSPPREFPKHIAFVQSDSGHLVEPRPTGMRGDDYQAGKIGRKFVNGGWMRMSKLAAHPAGHARSHAGRTDVNHHRHPQLIDQLKQRVDSPVIDREMPHDRMEMKPQHFQILDGVPGLSQRLFDPIRVPLLHSRYKVVRAGRRCYSGFQIQSY